MKDLFSSHSKDYSRYRPGYPAELYNFLRKLCRERNRAWDCGTGNGQVAGELATFFEQVYATDISISQLSQAVQKENIHYTKQAAENTIFPDAHFDLVTVGQAVHWFDFEKFNAEVKRVLKKDAVIGIFGYALFRSNAETDEIIRQFYNNIIGSFWAPERRFLEENYRTIPFPFQEIEVPEIKMKQKWSFERLIGYLNTWSAVKAYEKEHKQNPVELVRAQLREGFGEVGEVEFPILLRVGRNSD
ncbi:class I SAM-dependent methyltransferase [Salinimicrobium tongyeongense]|uniref:Class I SAM-dependent methyltransferase n=1 Tax=Salinimicrobium tongyeongense TaxID=2809707 RepID=A0ABY6NQA0_9FLAO|nr:class I SAM-dependent methyltransferase [Salinimicrobium tongyeongense]UZH55090.1 class I SAM-dependent methyltransferase [Salinimicrobium tongyeongense]